MGPAGFGYGTARRTSAAGLSSRRPSNWAGQHPCKQCRCIGTGDVGQLRPGGNRAHAPSQRGWGDPHKPRRRAGDKAARLRPHRQHRGRFLIDGAKLRAEFVVPHAQDLTVHLRGCPCARSPPSADRRRVRLPLNDSTVIELTANRLNNAAALPRMVRQGPSLRRLFLTLRATTRAQYSVA